MRQKIPYKIYPDTFGPPDAHLYTAMLNVQIALTSANAPAPNALRLLLIQAQPVRFFMLTS
jgi:hypothetical protein